jgi:hypothetical protein
MYHITARPPWFRSLQAAKASPEVAGRSLVHFEAEEAGEKSKYSAWLSRKSRTCWNYITIELGGSNQIKILPRDSKEVVRKRKCYIITARMPGTATRSLGPTPLTTSLSSLHHGH